MDAAEAPPVLLGVAEAVAVDDDAKEGVAAVGVDDDGVMGVATGTLLSGGTENLCMCVCKCV